jgi:hypothetical protein
MDLLDIVRTEWSFTGLEPVRVLDSNEFGNLLVEGADGRIWRICPEELSCEAVAPSHDGLADVRASEDWKMGALVERATASMGPPGEGRCFCLKVPGVLGGEYELHNMGTIEVGELIAFAGDLAAQLKDVPDGTQIKLEVAE